MQTTNHALRLQRTTLASATLAFALCGPAAAGEPTPGSLLLFPEFDSQIGGRTSVITVTNANPEQAVRTHWTYVDGATCQVTDRSEILTPNDTLTVLVTFHNPIQGSGYLFVTAVDASLRPISFEWLIGSCTSLDGLDAFDYTVDPVAFHGFGADGQLTDIDADGVRDLDGNEYSEVVDELLVPRFLGQSRSLQSDLVLLNLTGGTGFTAIVNLLVFNDNEEAFSAAYTFQCWEKTPLLGISGLFAQEFLADFTNHDPDEIVGAPAIESGWFRIDGSAATSPTETILDPAILGFLIERSPSGLGAAELPFGIGLQGNGALLEFGSGLSGKGSPPDLEPKR